MQQFCRIVCLLISTCFAPALLAWDSVGHRVTAAVAYHYLEQDTRDTLLEILREHPRFQQDFVFEIPAFIDRDNETELNSWLLGQAAYWPDIVRGFPANLREQYNRPAWHYTDGAWVRGAALQQGNIYIGLDRFRDIAGTPAFRIRSERDVSNVVTALDLNTRVLADRSLAMTERAIALCWVLHLMADIHQPLHAGSAYSPTLFLNGDQGGNAIPTDERNLHARWDRAVAGAGVGENLRQILAQLNDFVEPASTAADSDWTLWLSESRQLLDSAVYSSELRSAIGQAEDTNRDLAPVTLDPEYVEQMQTLARQRLGQAGIRMANWFNRELN